MYFTMQISTDDKPISKILSIDKRNYDIKVIDIQAEQPSDIFKYEDKFLITNYNPVEVKGTKVSVVDEEGRLYKDIELNNELSLTQIYGKYLVVANLQKLSLYDINTFELKREVKLDIDSESYVSAIIIRGNWLKHYIKEVYTMDKKRNAFVIGLVVLMVVFTVVNFIISRYYTRGINSTKETDTKVSQSSVSSKQSSNSSSSEEKMILSFDEYQKFYE